MNNDHPQPAEPRPPGGPYRTLDKFDRLRGALVDLPDVTHTKPSTVQVVIPLTGEAQTFIVRTYRQREVGDTIFLEVLDSDGSVRLAIPPAVAEAIARQRESLTTKNRKKAAKEQALARKARGEVPAFLKNKKGRKAGKGGAS